MIVSTTIGGIPVELFLIEPDWTQNVTLELGIAVDATEGETGKEERQPESFHPRFKMDFTPDWKASDSEDLITMKATIGYKRVAIPIFPDTQTDISDNFILEGIHYVSWDGAGSYAVDANTYDNVAPLAFGYFTNNQFGAINETIGKTSLTFIEDCPYSHRVKIVPVTVDANFGLEPNWSNFSEVLKSPIEFSEVGQGRQRIIENRESVFRYEMAADFTVLDQAEISYLLSFWYQKKGRLHSFNVPAWFQPATATPETPDAYRARFKGERLLLEFYNPNVARCQLGFIQLPWELNDSGTEQVTDWLFEDTSNWSGFDANVTIEDVSGGVTGMPEKVVKIVPEDYTNQRGFISQSISGVENDTVVISAMVAKADSITIASGPRLGIKVYNSIDVLIADELMTEPVGTSLDAQMLSYTYVLPANANYYKASFLQPSLEATVPGDAYAYFGDCSVIHYKDGAEVLSEKPVQSGHGYAFQFDYEVPGKSSVRFVDWERSIEIGGITFDPYRMTVESLSMGTRLFNEEAKISYSHESDNPLLEFVIGGMERLVSLTLYEGNPNRPDSFAPVFVGKLKSLNGKGRKLIANFSAFGSAFENKIPGFTIQSRCNYMLGDANCKKDLATLEAVGTAGSVDLSENNQRIFVHTLSGTLTTVNDPGSNPGDRFAGGYLVIGTADNYQIRYIRKTINEGGTNRSFIVNRPIDPTKVDDSDGNVHVFPGCGGNSWECSGFWDNYVNFGGHPYVPERLDTVSGKTPIVGK
jgi:hypothetical protein